MSNNPYASQSDTAPPEAEADIQTISRETSNSDPAWEGWLREVELRVPDPDAAVDYYAELLGGSAVDGTVVLGSSTRIVLDEGPPGFRSASLDFARGFEPAGMHGPDDEGYVSDPDGRRFKISAPAHIEERLTDPQPRLGHLTFESPDPILQQSFFEKLGFKVSEGLGQNFRWLRCNPIHHTLAFSRAPEPKLHHVGIEMPDRAAIVDGCDHIAKLGHFVQYGPGRHLAGGNLFVYFLDRYGIRFEFFCELERVYPHDRDPLIREGVDRNRSINTWGPQPPEEYFQGV